MFADAGDMKTGVRRRVFGLFILMSGLLGNVSHWRMGW